MNKRLIIAVGLAVLACACEPKASAQNPNQQMNNPNQQQQQKRSNGGCCETEKPQTPAITAPQQQQSTVATPEVKASDAKVEVKTEKTH